MDKLKSPHCSHNIKKSAFEINVVDLKRSVNSVGAVEAPPGLLSALSSEGETMSPKCFPPAVRQAALYLDLSD